MRFLHTSDWHLGRILEQHHLTDDQHHVLDQLVALAKDRKVDAVLVSGDVYDRGVPPPEAVDLLNDVVSRLALDLRVPVIIIAGNHDSRQRLGFGAKILERGRLYMFGTAAPTAPFVDLTDAYGSVRFYALPYAEPAEWREALGDEAIRDHQAGFARYIKDVRTAHPKGLRSVLLAHCFAAGGRESESERPLMLGGGGQVDAALFDSFDYTALGHLHRPQRVGKAWYSGSLLKYSKSEADHDKSVNIVEMDAEGACQVERVRLAPKRDLRVVAGLFEDLMKGSPSQDYIHVVLRDTGPVLDSVNRLRQLYPNLISLERPEVKSSGSRLEAAAMARMSDDQLFAAFFEQTTGQKPNEGQMGVFRTAAEAARRAGDESPS
jgi:exonuclease SbcD